MEQLYFTVDILGTVAFAISGVLVAMEKRLDLFGVGIIALVTALGGGTLRDLLIGNLPVNWTTALPPGYAYLCGAGLVIGSRLLAVRFRIALPDIYRKRL